MASLYQVLLSLLLPPIVTNRQTCLVCMTEDVCLKSGAVPTNVMFKYNQMNQEASYLVGRRKRDHCYNSYGELRRGSCYRYLKETVGQAYKISYQSSFRWVMNGTFHMNCSCLKYRLVNGSTPDEGRVEIFYRDRWTSMSEQKWTDADAEVLCRMLGYDSDYAEVLRNAYFGQGSSRVVYHDFHCGGTESDFRDCYSMWFNYTYDKAVGVKCHSDKSTNSQTMSMPMRTSTQSHPATILHIRLAGGHSSKEGRIEVLLSDGSWYTVCSDGWDGNDAKVVCRMLGLDATIVEPFPNANYGKSSIPVQIGDIRCTGSETHLGACTYSILRSGDCESSFARVRCSARTPLVTFNPPTITTSTISTRLPTTLTFTTSTESTTAITTQTTVTTKRSSPTLCEDSMPNCDAYGKNVICQYYPELAEQSCQKSCSICN